MPRKEKKTLDGIFWQLDKVVPAILFIYTLPINEECFNVFNFHSIP